MAHGVDFAPLPKISHFAPTPQQPINEVPKMALSTHVNKLKTSNIAYGLRISKSILAYLLIVSMTQRWWLPVILDI